jgi:hypothetical protein
MRLASLAVLMCSLSVALEAGPQPVTIERLPANPTEQPIRPGAPPRDRRAAETGTGQIKGRVVAADSGNPLRRVQIRLTSPDLRMSRTATTDPEGRFEFRELPAGRFTLGASKPGFVSLQFGQRRPFEQGRPIELADKQVQDRIDFRLPRGGVVSGRVVDEFGDPVADAQVAAMQLRYMNGRRRPVSAGRPAQTNDLGQFRIWGLPPGEYVVSATLRSFGAPDAQMIVGASQDPTGYAPTFYPGTGSVAEAQRVAVTLGAEASGVEFALLPVRTARISGIVVDAEGKPYVEGNVTLMQTLGGEPIGGMMFFPGGGGRLGPDGSFTIANVTPGEYSLQARVRRSKIKPDGAPPPEFMGPGEGDSATTSIVVAGEDISGIVMVATKGARLSGRVTFDPAPPDASRLENLRVMGASAGGEMTMMMMGHQPSPVGADGKFELTGLTGRRLLRAFGAPGWYLKSVRVDGREMIDTPLEFKGAEEITNVQVVLTQSAAQIAGTVVGSNGQAVKDYAVVLFPDDKDLWGPDSRYFGTARPDQEGKFKLAGLPPASYLIVALEYVDAQEWRDPEFLERLREAATRVSAHEGQIENVELKLVTVP